jgi:hypothetical protein
MKNKKFNKLKLGLYRVYWKSGGTSVAAIGQTSDGTKWVAPTNWTGTPEVGTNLVGIAVINYASEIKKVELITVS